jgi:hypothetical protein
MVTSNSERKLLSGPRNPGTVLDLTRRPLAPADLGHAWEAAQSDFDLSACLVAASRHQPSSRECYGCVDWFHY